MSANPSHAADALWPTFLDYCCPLCKGPLDRAADRYVCPPCGKTYPIVLGIPDFRVFPDPYISIQDDWEKARRLMDRYPSVDFQGLVEYYWSITPNTPPDLARRFVRHVLSAVDRGRRSLDSIRAGEPSIPFGRDRAVLEVGCGTGGFLAAAAERFGLVVGIDIAFRWLIAAKKRHDELGIAAQLVCCCAEYLPFADQQFDLEVASDVIEHTERQEDLIREAHRALRPGGAFYAATPNRLSLTRDPHVRVWGLGWLPRRWAKTYVRLVRGVQYDHIRLLSSFELRRMVRRTPFGRCRITLPTFNAEEQKGLSARERFLIRAYHTVKDWPGIRHGLLAVGPMLQVICRREAEGAATRA
ncbi:MAG: methyltransferase domain-containing protein [Gemmataceae bacterium]